MKSQIIITCIAALILAVDASAQVSLTSLHNGYRDGDEIYRIVARDTVIGNRGENCVWELPSVQKGENYFKQTIYLRNDSLTIAEGGFLLHYIATDKELLMRGYQNRDMLGIHDKLMPELSFPFAYGDSIADTYSRKTTYFDSFTIEGEGTCYTVCDGIGILTDGDETLKDVLRVHHHNTIVSRYNNMLGGKGEPVISEVTEDKYLWYCSGCRYPVMDTRIVISKSDGKIVSDTTFTSLYMPELQASELAYDDANYQLIAQKENQKQPDESGKDAENQFPIKISASLQDSKSQILLNYQVTGNVDCAFYAYDLAGRLLGSVAHIAVGEGEYHESMILKSRPINSIIMLTIVADDMKQVVRVY